MESHVVLMAVIFAVLLMTAFAWLLMNADDKKQKAQRAKLPSQATVKPQAQTMSEPSPMQLAIHRDNESIGKNKALLGCSSGCLVVILIGFVVLLVASILIGQAIAEFFEGVREFFDALNPWNWGWNNGRGKP